MLFSVSPYAVVAVMAAIAMPSEGGHANHGFIHRIRLEDGTQAAYRLKYRDNECEVLFLVKPSYVEALSMRPAKLEPQLRKGTWLVLTFQSLIVRDVKAIKTALETSVRLRKQVAKDLRLGIRPFLEYEEIEKWVPKYVTDLQSPVWVLISDGRPISWRGGISATEDVFSWAVAELKKRR